MRYGAKPSSRAHRPEHTLRNAIQIHPNIKKWTEVAYPFFMVEVDCLEEKTEEITRLELFILRAIHEAKAMTAQSISMLLGLEQKYITKVLNLLISADHLVENSGNGLVLTAAGIRCLQTNQKQSTKTVPRCILLDGLTKKPLPVDFYRPMNHSFLRGHKVAKNIRRLIPNSVEERDLSAITHELSREDKEKFGLPQDLVSIVADTMAFEIVYHIFHAGIFDNKTVLVFDSCSGEERTEFKALQYSLLKDVHPQIEERLDMGKLKEILFHDFQMNVVPDEIDSDDMGRLAIYVAEEDFTSDSKWEYKILTKPNVFLYDGSIVTFYPKDEQTLKKVLLRYIMRRFKVAIGSGAIENFNIDQVAKSGFEEITSGSRKKLQQPEIGYLHLREFALDHQENLVFEAVDDLLGDEEEDVYADLFT